MTRRMMGAWSSFILIAVAVDLLVTLATVAVGYRVGPYSIIMQAEARRACSLISREVKDGHKPGRYSTVSLTVQ